MSGILVVPQIITGSGSVPIGAAGGELSGTYPNPNVITINGASVPDSDSVPVGHVLQISSIDTLTYAAINLAGGSNFVSGILPTTNQANQALAGDLSGTTNNATVAKINGTTLPAGGSLTIGNLLTVSGSGTLSYSPLNLAGGSNFVSGVLPTGNQAAQSLAGDLSGTTASGTVIKINGASVPVAGSLTTGNLLSVSGSGSLHYAPLNLAGGSNYLSGALPAINQASQSLGGDLSGTTDTATVLKINGTSVAATPSANQLLIASSGSTSSWTLLNDANVSSSAAIAGSKLAYTDNLSPVLDSTTMQGAIDAIKSAAVATAIQKLTQTFNLASLQGAGAVALSTFNVGSALPSNARVLGAEISVSQVLAGTGLATAVATVQSSGDVAGSLVAGASLLGLGLIGGNGTNQYLSRGSSQITAIITLTGTLFSALTAGSITVNVFYAVVA